MRYVYIIRNLVNNKVYIGQTKNFAQRKAGHLYAARKGNERPLYRSIRKHGEDNFSFEILEECEDNLINEREQHWVTHFDSFNPEKGYNLTNGGSQTFSHSSETKKKIGDANLKRVGCKNPRFGKTSPWLTIANKKRRGEKGVQRFGSDNPSFGKKGVCSPIAKLNQEQIEIILKMKGSCKSIGVKFGVSKTTIERIRNGTSSYITSR